MFERHYCCIDSRMFNFQALVGTRPVRVAPLEMTACKRALSLSLSRPSSEQDHEKFGGKASRSWNSSTPELFKHGKLCYSRHLPWMSSKDIYLRRPAEPSCSADRWSYRAIGIPDGGYCRATCIVDRLTCPWAGLSDSHQLVALVVDADTACEDVCEKLLRCFGIQSTGTRLLRQRSYWTAAQVALATSGGEIHAHARTS